MSHLLCLVLMVDVDLGDESGLDLVQHPGLRGSNSAAFVGC
jgi:hypothetical protein